jgi:hypothetical protein
MFRFLHLLIHLMSPQILCFWDLVASAGLGTLGTMFGSYRGSQQAALDRAQQQRQWEALFERTKEMRIEDIARQEAAIAAAAAQWDAQQAQLEAQWRNTQERQLPNIAASRAILGSTMQTDVPAFRPRYSEAEGVPREKNPYADFIYQGPRSA